jgi:hypothetical protein
MENQHPFATEAGSVPESEKSALFAFVMRAV